MASPQTVAGLTCHDHGCTSVMQELTQNVGAYRISKKLGQGAFGAVFLAYQPFLDRQVAIKTLLANVTQTPEQQFMHEARTIARLRHPNIVTVFEFGTIATESEPLTYMVMEYLPGETLQKRAAAERLDAATVLRILNPLAMALDYAHAHHVIHRDLKPANILFDAQDRPVIVDFGLAKLLEISGGDHAESKLFETSVRGTPAYMSPEQATGEAVGPQSDQYALATIAYELLTGHFPFTAENALGMIQARIMETPLPLGAPFPDSANRVIMRALANDPAERYPTAGEFVAELQNALLPDDYVPQVMVVSDPIQVAQLRFASQSLMNFLWGLVIIALIVFVFITGEFLRSYANADGEFIWDGILASNSIHDAGRDVLAVWPGSPAAQAGIQAGDFLLTDLTWDHDDQTAAFLINGQSRSRYPVNWQPREGDVIQRTVYRQQQPIQVDYTLSRSPYLLIIFAIHLPSALLGLLAVVWMMRRWPGEARLQLFVMLVLMGCFVNLALAVSSVLINVDTLATYLLLALCIQFVLSYPTNTTVSPVRWWLWLPSLIGLVEYLTQQDIFIGDIALDTIAFGAMGLAIGVIVYRRWLRRDIRRYPSLWWLVLMLVTLVSTILTSEVLDISDNYATVSAVVGDGLRWYLLNNAVMLLGGTVAILTGTIGVHRLQRQVGPSFVVADSAKTIQLASS